MKCGELIDIPTAFRAADLAEFCKQNGGSNGDHEVYARVLNDVVTLCLVKRLPEARVGEPNGKVWAFLVIPRLSEEV